jgi:hypothetical protein
VEKSRPFLKMKKPVSKTKPAEMQHPDSVFELIGVKSILEQLKIAPHTAEIEFNILADAIRKKQRAADAAFLLKLADLVVATLNRVCHDVPQVFQPLASKRLEWPGLIGVHKDIELIMGQLKNAIRLGANSPLNTVGKTWTSATVETKIAHNLFQRIEGRDGNPTWPPLRGNLAWPLWVKGRFDLPESVVREIQTQLDPLSRKNYQQWWKIAEHFFLHRYGKDFENHKDFKGYWKNVTFKGDTKARAHIRSSIKKQIKQAFRSIAPKSSAVE